jgi:hypothetical protein
MVSMAETIILLGLIHFIFWRKVYGDEFVLSTSEILETHFSHFDWMGRTKNVLKDNLFYYYPACMPFLSTFYPPHFLAAKLSSRLGIDLKFKLFVRMLLAHHFLGSILTFLMLRQWYPDLYALFGTVTLCYVSYCIKTNNLCIVYTMAWIPGMFIKGPIGILSFGMAILGGYYPILVYILPFSIALNSQHILGVLIGLPQIIPFLWYYPKSIKMKFGIDQKYGRVDPITLLDMILPKIIGYKNGVLHSEYSTFMGILTPFLIPMSRSWWAIPFIVSTLWMVGLFPVPFRAASRFVYIFVFSGTLLAVDGLFRLNLSDKQIVWLMVIQFISLLRFRSIFPAFPFCQFQRPPSYHFKRYQAGKFKFPFRSGYFFNEPTKGYSGGFCLKETFERNNISDPNGQPIYN